MGGRDLSGAEAEGALRALLAWDLEVDGDVAARTAFVAALLASLRTKGETAEEVAGLARAMQAEMVRVDGVAEGTPVLDIVGSGGPRREARLALGVLALRERRRRGGPGRGRGAGALGRGGDHLQVRHGLHVRPPLPPGDGHREGRAASAEGPHC